ncbi:MAG: hypothetical protein WKG07_39650 [Hymenobacter sp.]
MARMELLLDPANDDVQVQALPADTAVVLFIRHQPPGERKARYVFQHYGANLHLRNEVSVEIPPEYELKRMTSEPGIAYALFNSLTKPGHLLAVAYDVRGGQVRSQDFDTKLCRDVVRLKAMSGRLLVNVTLSDQLHQTVLLLDVANGRFQFLPSLYEPLNTELTSVADRPAGRAEFVLSQSNGRKQRLLLKRLSATQGELLNSELVQTESERSLLTAQLSSPEDTTTRLLAGTYGLRDVRYAQGLFATDLTARTGNTAAHSGMRFYDFKRFRHFLITWGPATRPASRAAPPAAKPALPAPALALPPAAARADAPARRRLHPRGRGVHAPVQLRQRRLRQPVVAELLPPHRALRGLRRLFRWLRGPSRTFIGFRTTHVLVCGFDKRGNLQWDNNFVVGPGIVRSELEEAVQPLPRWPMAAWYWLIWMTMSCTTSASPRAKPVPTTPKWTWLPPPPPSRRKVLDVHQPDPLPWANGQYVASGFQAPAAPAAAAPSGRCSSCKC